MDTAYSVQTIWLQERGIQKRITPNPNYIVNETLHSKLRGRKHFGNRWLGIIQLLSNVQPSSAVSFLLWQQRVSWLTSDLWPLSVSLPLCVAVGGGRCGIFEPQDPAGGGGAGPRTGETGHGPAETGGGWEGGRWEWKVSADADLMVTVC